MEITSNLSLKELNTFGLDIHASHYCIIHTVDELRELIKMEQAQGLPKLILGGGSNMLFTEDYRGLIIHNQIMGISIASETDDHVLICTGGGVNWHNFVLYCVDHGYGGIENLALIPGCVGAAPIQNIGAYGVEIKDTFYKLTAVELNNGSIHQFSREECQFGYRDSIFKREAKNKFIIVDVTFKLSKHPQLNMSYGAIANQISESNIVNPTIKDVCNTVIVIRKSKLPDPKEIGNAGSFFKNPEIPIGQFEKLKEKFPDVVGYQAHHDKMKVAAGWLIEKSGWKGKRIGNVGMHDKQALVLVNYGNATGEELIAHARKVKAGVMNDFGIDLEMEVNIIS